MRTRNEMMPPADAGPVERPVRPGDRGETTTANHALAAAFGAADAAKEQDLRGYYPMAARVLAEEVRRRRAALDQMHAEYEDMKSLLLGNARNLNLERERLHAALQLAVWAMRAPLDDWKGECERKALDAAHAALGPNVGGNRLAPTQEDR